MSGSRLVETLASLLAFPLAIGLMSCGSPSAQKARNSENDNATTYKFTISELSHATDEVPLEFVPGIVN